MREKKSHLVLLFAPPSVSVALVVSPSQALVKVMEDGETKRDRTRQWETMPETERHPKWERERGRGDRRGKKAVWQTQAQAVCDCTTLCSFCLAVLQFYFQKQMNSLNPNQAFNPEHQLGLLALRYYFLIISTVQNSWAPPDFLIFCKEKGVTGAVIYWNLQKYAKTELKQF